MKEEEKRAIERVVTANGGLSRQVIADAIGEAVLALLESGRDCDRATLLQWFDEAINATPRGVRRLRYEASRTALQDACSRTS